MNTKALVELLGPSDVLDIIQHVKGRRFITLQQNYASVLWAYDVLKFEGASVKFCSQLASATLKPGGQVIVNFAGTGLEPGDWTFEDEQKVGGWQRTFDDAEAMHRAEQLAGQRDSQGKLIFPPLPVPGWVS